MISPSLICGQISQSASPLKGLKWILDNIRIFALDECGDKGPPLVVGHIHSYAISQYI